MPHIFAYTELLVYISILLVISTFWYVKGIALLTLPFSYFCHLPECGSPEITQTCLFNLMPVEESTGSKQGILNHHEECTIPNWCDFISEQSEALSK